MKLKNSINPTNMNDIKWLQMGRWGNALLHCHILWSMQNIIQNEVGLGMRVAN